MKKQRSLIDIILYKDIHIYSYDEHGCRDEHPNDKKERTHEKQKILKTRKQTKRNDTYIA